MNINYIVFIICLFYANVISDIVSLVYLKSQGYESEYGLFITLFILERVIVILNKIYRLFTSIDKYDDECQTCISIMSSIIFLDFFIACADKLKNPNSPTKMFSFLLNLRAIFVALVGQFINIHAIFSMDNSHPAFIINAIFQILLFVIANLEYYYELDISVDKEAPNPVKEVIYIFFFLFSENFIKVVFWGFFIALTSPKGIWAIVIIEFIGGFFLEMGYQWNQSSSEEDLEKMKKEKEDKEKNKKKKIKELNDQKKKQTAANKGGTNNKDKEQKKPEKEKEPELPATVKMCLAIFGPSIQLFKRLLIPLLVGFQFTFYGRIHEDIMIKEFDEEPKENFKKGNSPIYFRYVEFLFLFFTAISQYTMTEQMIGFFVIVMIFYVINFFWITAYIIRKYKKNPILISFREIPNKTDNEEANMQKIDKDNKNLKKDSKEKNKNIQNQDNLKKNPANKYVQGSFNDEDEENANNNKNNNRQSQKKQGQKQNVQEKEQFSIDEDDDEEIQKQKKNQYNIDQELDDDGNQFNKKQSKNQQNTLQNSQKKKLNSPDEEQKDSEPQQINDNQKGDQEDQGDEQGQKKKGGFMGMVKSNFDKAKTFVNQKVDKFKQNYDDYKNKNQNNEINSDKQPQNQNTNEEEAIQNNQKLTLKGKKK